MASFVGSVCNAIMQIYTFGMYAQLKAARKERRAKSFNQNVVAAGDPAQEAHKRDTEFPVPETLLYKERKINVNGFKHFVVDGDSMSLEGINNGDVLLCRSLNGAERDAIASGKYVVIKVDPAYYSFKKKTLSFQRKLRKTLMEVDADMDVETLIAKLKNVDDSVLLSDNEKRLKEKFKEIKSYYKKDELMLSLTYRDGALRYSFHPVALIESVAEYVLSRQNNDWNVNQL